MFKAFRAIGVCLIFVILLDASAMQADKFITHLNSPQTQKLGLPFSEAVKVGNALYLSGQIGVKPGTTKLVEGGLLEESRQTMENIKNTLETFGYSLSDVVKCTVMLADIGQWKTFNRVYLEFFNPPFPARSAFGANGLALGAKVEIECIAAKNDNK